MKRVELLRPALLYLVSLSCGAAAPTAPAWRAKEKFYERVKAGEPIVTVNTRSLEGAKRQLIIAGGGRVKTPRQFTYDFARRLDRIAETSGFVEGAKMNAARDRLHLTFKALGHRAEFDVRVKADDARHRLDFEILGGPLAGLTSTLDFAEVGGLETEVAIDGHYDYTSFPLKGALLTVGMEGVFKKMAEHLRDAAVAEFKAVDKIGPAVKDSGPDAPGM